jgi:O-succinylbenzoic acid--CoA ligase
MMGRISFKKLIQKPGDHIALMDKQKVIYYPEYFTMLNNINTHLIASGIKRGERIAIIGENSLAYTLLTIALFNIEAIAVPMNNYLPVKQMIAYLKKIAVNKIFSATQFMPAKKVKNIEYFNINDLLKITDIDKPTSNNQTENLIDLDREVLIIFTSGSGGDPKAVMLSFANLYYNALGANKNIPFQPNDRWLLTLPCYHIGGISILIRALLSGGTVVIKSPEEAISDYLENFQITHISLVSTQLWRLLQEKRAIHLLKRLKVILLGGAPVAHSLIKKAMDQQLPVFPSYGSTEMASQIATITPGWIKDQIDTAGRVLPYRKLKIAEDGEILVKGLTLFKGYVTQDGVSRMLNKDGWFATGDLGKINEQGNLCVLGRKDNMFISGGENIYPQEIEKYLLEISQVKNALVVPIADQEFGSVPVAFIQMVNNRPIPENQYISFLKRKIARFKIPRKFFPWPVTRQNLKPDRLYFQTLALKHVNRKN